VQARGSARVRKQGCQCGPPSPPFCLDTSHARLRCIRRGGCSAQRHGTAQDVCCLAHDATKLTRPRRSTPQQNKAHGPLACCATMALDPACISSTRSYHVPTLTIQAPPLVPLVAALPGWDHDAIHVHHTKRGMPTIPHPGLLYNNNSWEMQPVPSPFKLFILAQSNWHIHAAHVRLICAGGSFTYALPACAMGSLRLSPWDVLAPICKEAALSTCPNLLLLSCCGKTALSICPDLIHGWCVENTLLLLGHSPLRGKTLARCGRGTTAARRETKQHSVPRS